MAKHNMTVKDAHPIKKVQLGCGHIFEVNHQSGGRLIRCHCGKMFEVLAHRPEIQYLTKEHKS